MRICSPESVFPILDPCMQTRFISMAVWMGLSATLPGSPETHVRLDDAIEAFGADAVLAGQHSPALCIAGGLLEADWALLGGSHAVLGHRKQHLCHCGCCCRRSVWEAHDSCTISASEQRRIAANEEHNIKSQDNAFLPTRENGESQCI